MKGSRTRTIEGRGCQIPYAYCHQLVLGRMRGLYLGEPLPNGLAYGWQARCFSSKPQAPKSEKKTKVIDNRKSPKIDLKVIYHESTSKYEGEPLIQPRIPYQYDVKTFKRDPKNKTLMSRIGARAAFTADRTKAYCRDIYTGRTDAVVFKTVEFFKRHVLWARGCLYSVWLGLKHMKKGLSRVKNDVFFLIGFQRRKVRTKYTKDDYFERRKVRQVKEDVIKFVPFSLFLIIPGGELFIPPYLMIFPNSMPSQFMDSGQRNKKFKEIKQKRDEAAKKLMISYPNYFKDLRKDDHVLEEDREIIEKFAADLKKPYLLPTDLLVYKQIFKRYATFGFFPVDKLEKIAQFLGIEPVTGFNTINNILGIFRLRISLTTPGIEFIARKILARELNMYINRIRQEDTILSFEPLDSYTEEQINKICFRRGIDIDKQDLKERKNDIKLWLSISNQRNVPHSLLVFTRAHDYTSEMFEISDDEHDFEILRRSPSDTYYLEKLQVFEETFGINKLQNMVHTICTKVKERQIESEKGEKLKGLFLNDEDMRMMIDVHEDFLTRHTTIKTSINDTYRIGNQLLDYVEKQMIIDYHLRGDQSRLEEEFPDIAKKAKKFLGYETYFELSLN